MSFANNELSSIQIEKKMKELNVPLIGVFCKDELPKYMKKGNYIINMDNHTGKGTHWVALYYNYPENSLYFDPFGFIAPSEIEDRIKPYIYDSNDVQAYDSSSCGYYCIAFLMFLHKNHNIYKAYRNFIKLFSKNQVLNEKICQNLLKIII